MVRLADLHEAGREALEALECPSFEDKPFVSPGSMTDRKVAIVSSAGLIQRGDRPFKGGDAGYRVFTDEVPDENILVSHISSNFDRTAAIANIESIFPRKALAEMSVAGEVGAVAGTHYSFMGATDPTTMEAEAAGLSQWLKADGVDTVVFLPV